MGGDNKTLSWEEMRMGVGGRDKSAGVLRGERVGIGETKTAGMGGIGCDRRDR
jgi:hypothetical protein